MEVLLIGGGQLGSRHLQGISKAALTTKIVVMDPSETSLDLCKQRLSEIGHDPLSKRFEFHTSLNTIKNKSFDLLISATTAKFRMVGLKASLERFDIKHALLEKVLFQSEEELEEAGALLSNKNCLGTVNCPRRSYPFYKRSDLLDEFRSAPIHVLVDGGDWGMACNSIHFLDLVSFWKGSVPTIGSEALLEKRMLESKRPGNWEVAGVLEFQWDDGSTLVLNSRKDTISPQVIIVKSKIATNIFEESLGLHRKIIMDTGWKIETEAIKIPMQSELSQGIVEYLEKNGSTGLTDYSESSVIHGIFLKTLNNHFSQVFGKKLNSLNIT